MRYAFLRFQELESSMLSVKQSKGGIHNDSRVVSIAGST